MRLVYESEIGVRGLNVALVDWIRKRMSLQSLKNLPHQRHLQL